MLADLDKVYGSQTVSYILQLQDGACGFKNFKGRESLDDDPRLEHSLSVFTGDDITGIHCHKTI